MKEQEKKMLELVREIYKLAKEISPETGYLSMSVLETPEYKDMQIRISNNHWEIETDKIDIWGGSLQ